MDAKKQEGKKSNLSHKKQELKTVDGHNTTTNCLQVFYFTITFLWTWNLERNIRPIAKILCFVETHSERYQIGLQCICSSVARHICCWFSISVAHLFLALFRFYRARAIVWRSLKYARASNEIQFGCSNRSEQRIRRKCISCHSMKRIPHIIIRHHCVLIGITK